MPSDFKLLIFMSVEHNSSVSCVSASCPKGRRFDPGFSSKIFFLEKMQEIILSCMVPLVDSHILSVSLIRYKYLVHNVIMHIVCVNSYRTWACSLGI